MKLNILSFFITMVIAQTSLVYASSPKPVDYTNAKKFSGLWYEIARTYNSFEKDCVAASVEYTLIEPFKYDIKNRCFDKTIDGKLIQFNGTAIASNGNNMSELDMTYFWIFTKEYKIIYLDEQNEQYETAVLVDTNLETVWIMHRKPFMKKEKLDNIVVFLKKYMDTSKLIYTPQDKQGIYK